MAAKQVRNLAFILAAVLVLSSGFNNCGQRTRVNYKESTLLATGSLRGGTSGGNPARTVLRFSPYADSLIDTGLESFSVCVATIHFTISGSKTGEVVHEVNETILLDPAGTPIIDLILPFGDYDGVTIGLAPTCSDNLSTEVTNKSGSFKSAKETSMIFEGDYSSDTKGHTLNLHIENIVQAVADATSEIELVDGLARRSGTSTVPLVNPISVDGNP